MDSIRRLTRSANGYSLLEMLVVIVIMGALIAITVFGVGPTLERGRIRSAASTIAGDLMFAQAEAARRRSTVVVVVVPGAKLLFVRDRADPSLIYRQRDLGPDGDYRLDALTASPTNMVEVLPNGLTRQDITFTATLSGNTRQIRFTRAGQIRVIVP